jgi:hypothetical protein
MVFNMPHLATLKKKRCFPEPFCGFCGRVKDRTLKKVPSESGFRGNPTEPFMILYQNMVQSKEGSVKTNGTIYYSLSKTVHSNTKGTTLK